MKASELRCGNYVNVPRKEQSPFRVDYFDRVKVYQDNGTYECPTFGEIPMHPLTWDLSDIEGIVLTPEILEKCGFEYVTDWTVRDKRKHDCVTFLDLGYMYLASGMMGGGVTLFQNDRRSTGTNIDYLHQLQNLYFCLVGKELEVKL